MNPTTDSSLDFVSAAPTAGSLDVSWIHGAPSKRHAPDPAIQVHHYDEHTVILRQSKTVNYEAPFLYLLFGNERALLLDTGATEDPELFPLRATVDRLVADWLEQYPREGYELVVAHSHGHHDHVAADAQFADRPATTVVARDADAVRSFFGFGESWPAETVGFDLGGRVLEVLASPGHHQASITLYDPWTGILLTGDTVLPGRLFAFDFAAYLDTLERLVAFAATRPVTHVLGCHVEMTSRPGRDYPIGAGYQPDERALQLTTAQLTAVRDAAAAVAGRPGVHRFDDFLIYNEPRKSDLLKLMARGMAHKARAAVLPAKPVRR
ncbi:MBL fold metallo-hydrolase [Kitasatospora azatica]|uniref:MBL fold metallo-hydrolase n=1 Tax=Kitasatospora azatica TaxID=58347 RepID=UPI0007C79242|nr:MBL fold metallo-hydrolase [Kitasatospora azatica]